MDSLQHKIYQCENYITIMREDLAANEKHLYNLYIELQEMEAAESNVGISVSEFEEQCEKELSELADLEAERQKELSELADLEAERQKELEELSLKEELINHPVGTKLKWVLNEDTYRVAIVTNKGVLQVKAVEDGCGECHEDGCTCAPCWEHFNNAPWRPRLPLKKTLFTNETEWRNSLPSSGQVIVTRPHTNDNALKVLSYTPLTGDTDPKKLKQLETRFPGGTFVLSTGNGQVEIEYFFHSILSRKKGITGTSFSDFGVGAQEKPALMVEWRGLYISLSHLF
jgi:hypothetical protein